MTALWLVAVWFFFFGPSAFDFRDAPVTAFCLKKGPGALYPALTAATH
jgi:hypothetical protein